MSFWGLTSSLESLCVAVAKTILLVLARNSGLCFVSLLDLVHCRDDDEDNVDDDEEQERERGRVMMNQFSLAPVAKSSQSPRDTT